ncbi:phage terminase large subunit [Herbaspirillum frisingense]|uniref:phage terminase large subunit n=1 Tax=Herbaspirillum frisingense TaxID=92645 RepID=UPI0039B0E326
MEFSEKERRAYRSLARADLFWFARWMFANRRGYAWQRSRHHEVVCDALMRVFRGECKRLIINIPPRYSKTELIKSMVAWSFGQNPDCEWIYTSYSGRLAATSSWDMRGILQDPEYKAIFPGVGLRNDSQARDEWRTTAGGVMYAVGSGGTITGYGAGKHRQGFGGAIIIDDPHKADEAKSDTIREGVIDWFQNTLESRKNSPDTPVIVIMQRLHERDLAGWLLDGGNGETWDHVCLPAIQDDGTALWPEKHSIEELRRMEQSSPYVFSGQYQQRPAPKAGGFFSTELIKVVEALPAGLQFARGWDFAGTEESDNKGADWTVGALIGKDALGRFYIADINRFRGSSLKVEQAVINTAAQDGVDVPISGPQDPGQAGKAQAHAFVRMLAGFDIEFTPETGPKTTRASPFAAQVEAGNVFMLKAPWNKPLTDELGMFPNGAHDDQADAISRAFHRLLSAKRWAF